jgi:hypothetical protein
MNGKLYLRFSIIERKSYHQEILIPAFGEFPKVEQETTGTTGTTISKGTINNVH